MSYTHSGGNRKFKSIDELAAFLSKKHQQPYGNKKFTTWRKIAELEFDGEGISPGTLNRIAKHGYEPKHPDVRRALGLPTFALAPTCAKCGAVHTTKTCRAPRPSSNPQLLKFIREIAVPFLEVRQK